MAVIRLGDKEIIIMAAIHRIEINFGNTFVL